MAKIAETQTSQRTQEKGKGKGEASVEVGGLGEAGLGTTRNDRRRREAAMEPARENDVLRE